MISDNPVGGDVYCIYNCTINYYILYTKLPVTFFVSCNEFGCTQTKLLVSLGTLSILGCEMMAATKWKGYKLGCFSEYPALDLRNATVNRFSGCGAF